MNTCTLFVCFSNANEKLKTKTWIAPWNTHTFCLRLFCKWLRKASVIVCEWFVCLFALHVCVCVHIVMKVCFAMVYSLICDMWTLLHFCCGLVLFLTFSGICSVAWDLTCVWYFWLVCADCIPLWLWFACDDLWHCCCLCWCPISL